jgi:aminoglycoside phosphotransferase (APT) family kinase protein
MPENLGHHEDSTLVEAAKLIRRYHDATVALFGTREAIAAGIEVACHNDLSPCNTVFQDGRPASIIDFDAAAPGSRAFDLGYAAWLWFDVAGQTTRRMSSCGVFNCLVMVMVLARR